MNEFVSDELSHDANETLRRAKRLVSYVVDWNTPSCFNPGHINQSLFCKYITEEPSCRYFVKFVDLLNLYACTLKLPWDNGLAVVVGVIMMVLLYILYMVIKYFLLPNYIYLMEVTPISSFAFNYVFFGPFLRLPDYVRNWIGHGFADVIKLNMMFSGYIGLGIRHFIIGVMLLSINGFHIKGLYWWSNMVLCMFGCIFVMVIVRLKYSIYINPGPIMYNTHSLDTSAQLMLLLIIIFRILVLIVSHQSWRMKRKQLAEEAAAAGAASADEADKTSMSTPSELSTVIKNALRTDLNAFSIWKSTVNGFANMKERHLALVVPFVPIYFLLANVIGVIDKDRPMTGWCKIVNCLSMFVFPLVLLYFEVSLSFWGGVLSVCWIMGLIIAIGTHALVEHSRGVLIFYATFGTTMATFLCNIIERELDNLGWQFCNMRFEAMNDQIPLLLFNSGDILAQIIFMYTFIENGLNYGAFGVFIGSVTDIVFMALPMVVYHKSYNQDTFLMFLANTETVVQFIPIVVGAVLFHVSMSGCEFRMSLFYYMIVLVITLLLVFFGCNARWMHPLGAMHSVRLPNFDEWA